ncbi:hypothetical protein [Candidatus Caldatribacterium sp.]|uniref:hypothetical protein n=1 Tax=Candidatus Caldatribacterium sp. TaxID=2282143 RepID=UPI0029966E04|nr:hypothetical protein [Candidatus Caldatribacterium sp.]MDW8081724.1 hypothetical protein [Candidatus Calescibacterium sp.]
MGISPCDASVGVKPEVVAAIVAALMEFFEAEKGPRYRPYVPRKSCAWKALALREGALRIRLGR